ncbi:MAG TPA: DinB family protein [Dehalococcoidia bacterium]
MSDDQSLIPSAIAVLAATPSVMREMLVPLSDELVAAQGSEGWSARDVVAHLAARQHPAIIGRVSAVLAENGAVIPDIPDDLMEVEPYRARPLEDLLREFEDGRAEAVALLKRIPPEQLQWRGVHSGVGEISIADIIHHVAYHDLVHVAQAARLAYAPLEPLRGAMRVFR